MQHTEDAPAWNDLVHEVRAEGTGQLEAATVAAFAIVVPDHATIEIADSATPGNWLLIGTWPHEDQDNVERPLTGRAHWGGTPGQQHSTNLGADDCPARYMARPCTLPDGHDSAHVYRSALAVADDAEACAQQFNARPCTLPAGHDDPHRFKPRQWLADADLPGRAALESRARRADDLPDELAALPAQQPWPLARVDRPVINHLAGHVSTQELGALVDGAERRAL